MYKGKSADRTGKKTDPQPAPKPGKLVLPLQVTESGSLTHVSVLQETMYENSTELNDLLERALGLSTERQQERGGGVWRETGVKSVYTSPVGTSKHTKVNSAAFSLPAQLSLPVSPSSAPLEKARTQQLTSQLSDLTTRYEALKQSYDTLETEEGQTQYKRKYQEMLRDGELEKAQLLRKIRALEKELERTRERPVLFPPVPSELSSLNKRLSSLEQRLSHFERLFT